jgi:hypothetical protein
MGLSVAAIDIIVRVRGRSKGRVPHAAIGLSWSRPLERVGDAERGRLPE